MNNLGVAKQALGDYLSASIHLQRAAELQETHLPPVHLRVAETQRNLARNALLSGAPDSDEAIADTTGTGIRLLDFLIGEGSERERLNFIGRFDMVSLPLHSRLRDGCSRTRHPSSDTSFGSQAILRIRQLKFSRWHCGGRRNDHPYSSHRCITGTRLLSRKIRIFLKRIHPYL